MAKYVADVTNGIPEPAAFWLAFGYMYVILVAASMNTDI
jgi:hypothetical protein